jgi:hypothetical protein
MMSTPASMTFAAENAAVNAAQVAANMDAMAVSLSGAATADAAWKTIFTSSKPWASTKVAIKVNTIETKNMARVAVVQKFCEIFAGFGVPGANIIIYDGNTTYGAGLSNYDQYVSLTDATKIQAVVSNFDASLGGTTTTAIGGGGTTYCTADIANGTIDILVNIATNKGHSSSFNGNVTLTMKNHFGTFGSTMSGQGTASPTHTIDYIFDINKSDAILGGTPVRQQLCFIDSLIANKASNTGTPESVPNYLVMGTFAPAVDYATIVNLRNKVMGIAVPSLADSYITTFDYATTDPQWVVVDPANADGGASSSSSSGGGSSSSGSSSGGGSSSSSSSSGGGSTSGGSSSGGKGSSSSSSGGGSTSSSSSSGGKGSSSSSSGGGGSSSGGGGNSSGGGGNSSSSGVSTSGGGGNSSSGGVSTSGGGGNSSSGGVSTSGGGGNSSSGGVSTSGGGGNSSGGSVSTSGGGGNSSGGGSSNGGNQAETASGNSGGGCDVAVGDRGGNPLGGMLAIGAVLAGALRRSGPRGSKEGERVDDASEQGTDVEVEEHRAPRKSQP